MDNFWPKGTDLYNKKTWHIFIKLNYNICHVFFKVIENCISYNLKSHFSLTVVHNFTNVKLAHEHFLAVRSKANYKLYSGIARNLKCYKQRKCLRKSDIVRYIQVKKSKYKCLNLLVSFLNYLARF